MLSELLAVLRCCVWGGADPVPAALAQQNLPELPAARRARYAALGLPAADAVVLADEPPTAAYFDAVLAAGAPAKPAANWLMGDIMAFCKASRLSHACVIVHRRPRSSTQGHARRRALR